MFFQYLENFDIYSFDFSGKVDEKDGLNNIEQFDKFLDEHLSGVIPLKLLVDFRKTVFDNTLIHNELAKAARQKLNGKPKNKLWYTAILNNQYTGSTFDNEHWFINKEEALNWLLSR
jgi:hypothetical protein